VIDAVQRYALWGQAFEIAVKRGVLTALLGSTVQRPEHLDLGAWTELGVAEVYGALARALQETDPNQRTRSSETVRHLFVLGMGLGQTAMREYLRTLKGDPEDYLARALWCPLQLPHLDGDVAIETGAALRDFHTAFAVDGPMDEALTRKGFPVRADFLLWLAPHSPTSYDQEFLCLEVSLNGQPETADYRDPPAHLEELQRFSWFMDSRSVFARVCAEVYGEGFDLSPGLKEHLPAFSSRDKPFYKLCQAASYIETSMRWLTSRGHGDHPFTARALSITQNGFESLAARYGSPAIDPRVELMSRLGSAYRQAEKIPDAADEALDDHIRHAFDRIRKSLPRHLRQQLVALGEQLDPGAGMAFTFSEALAPFHNPMSRLAWEEVRRLVEPTPALDQLLGADAVDTITGVLARRYAPGTPVTLRDLHAAAIAASMDAAKLGELAVLGLEGNPGIGKTTAVINWLKEQPDGFLFLYVSPRVIINDDVTGNLARTGDTQASGVLAVTTNSRLIATARSWHEQQARAAGEPVRWVDSAVVADGVADLRHPEGSTLILKPGDREALEAAHTGSRLRKVAETERQDRIVDAPSAGVLRVLARTTRALLQENANVSRVALTAAIQGYRELSSSQTTIDALSGLFRDAVTGRPGLAERRAFARRMPVIVVMVDELTGDGAGALFLHTVARWLDAQFIQPFQHEPLFRVILVVSDASLGNEVVLERYLSSGPATPDKVLVAPSAGNRPFRLAASSLKIGGKQRQVLHVMTNSYPAAQLTVDYRVRLDLVAPEETPEGKKQTIRQAIARQQGDALLNGVVQEIARALAAGAAQVIFFAQDKAFLRELEVRLTSADGEEPLVPRGQVAILDASVLPARRKELIAPDRRDRVKVFLMTSSGARGVSFPKTDVIIALLPRFNVEAALMEVAQLIYRGRGGIYTGDDGSVRTDGDWKNRRLVLLLQDYLPHDVDVEPRQWLRQVTDLLTFLVMVRSTIHTRITGDAGLERQKIALVPVGGIEVEEPISLMSSNVRAFLSECDVQLRDASLPEELRAPLAGARDRARRVFAKSTLVGTLPRTTPRSVARIEDLRRFCHLASAGNAPLLPDLSEDLDALLPDNLYCVGPFWLESWEHLDKQEHFSVEGWLTDTDSQVRQLFGVLGHIKEERRLPAKLRQPAADLYRMLAREKEEATREFTTAKALHSPTTWLAVPVDYPRFWQPGPDGRLPSLDDHEAWRNALARCLSVTRDILPVIPHYEDIPFALVVGLRDPSRLRLIFDDRYLAASNELNLLNTILLSEDRPGPKGTMAGTDG
jgi:hypothetical protein